MMKQYRIGRIQTPWTNLDPPIRSLNALENQKLQEKQAGPAGHGHGPRRSVDLSKVGFAHGCSKGMRR